MTDIEFERAGRIARIIINRPERHNALDIAMIDAFHDALDKVAADKSARVLEIRARGASFCAGADINWMRRMSEYDAASNIADAKRLAGLFEKIAFLPLPTIVAVNGPAYGGGIGIVAACDFAIAVPRADFVLSEVKLGLIPAVISPHIIRAIGPHAAKRLFLSGRKFDAAEAERLGLLAQVVASEELDAAVDALSRQLLDNAPEAMAAAKELVQFVASKPLGREVIDGTADRIAARRASVEGKEGLTAFLEKRIPAWRKE
ncbi:MAG: enoyl-CoA hydratase/isomerase family protein [Proteobacteria bacterium]|nr:enoyl-CoA hydratase/isomerase family protein [Pseudomonadota bacterium]